MTIRVMGTVVDGGLRLDDAIDLPNESRVKVSIELIPSPGPDSDRVAAWESLKKLIRENSIQSGGVRFTRDELHDRDCK